ncbi:YbaB/EbfC family nucleoid-associated protein [Actinocrispum wychmicini]|uniref:YbaB/EbfC DNA-binding family protein n=1 Tax=Actinocrispum wychmicini TaxID=1213861 RepID=A0A4R2JMG4_9PSEU|nr:YbaB/EbfC family nucleoid-associated protein [Actinocrispum wychmicini]TCO58288.1 YbaB/EbfC DNA-binding family protein [Actinocrispum wychmicini]
MLVADVSDQRGGVLSADLERLAAEFEKFQARIKQVEVKFSGVGDMQERLAELAAVASSSDRTVKVTAGAGGSIKNIELTQDAVLQPAPALAATIMATLRAAVAEAAQLQAGIVDETVGEAFGIAVSDQVRAAQEEALGTAVDELSSPRSRPSAPPPDDDDYFNQGSIFSR